MYTSSPLLALCLILALGSAAPQPYGVDNYLPPRQSGCVYEITPEGEACKFLPLRYLPITKALTLPRKPTFNPNTQSQIPKHPSKNTSTPLTSSRLRVRRR